ncbi:DUF1259 domain-containing protein [Marininema halotolerans]|uniref:Uncharacterized protein n=1 Tax=Marininema halotolerans TaxID=1155944 RepID=A0A1I6TID1_9BACL|nr:DUF1259 domain-containing protein [Marininema halotolerans]SFS88959.1 protein of unknown function [Marininema halotolerans]
MNVSKQLCNQLAGILNANEITGLSSFPTYCTVGNQRTFSATILGKRTTDGTNNPFTFSRTTIKNKTLNTGWFSLLENEVSPVVDRLLKHGITVSSITDFSMFMRPRVIQVCYEVVENPIKTALALRSVLNILPNVSRTLPDQVTPSLRKLCSVFSKIIGADAMGVLGNSCEAWVFRDLNIFIQGQRSLSPLNDFINISFESLDPQGKALCIGEIGLLKDEVFPFLNEIRRLGGINYSKLYMRFLTTPQIYQFTYITIDNPINCALKARRAIRVLKT